MSNFKINDRLFINEKVKLRKSTNFYCLKIIKVHRYDYEIVFTEWLYSKTFLINKTRIENEYHLGLSGILKRL